MKAFACRVCGRLLVFENSGCLSCGTPQGYDPSVAVLVPLPTDGSRVRCAAEPRIGCNWLVDPVEAAPSGGLCASCRLTRTRPADIDTDALVAFARTESDKRRLVFQLRDLGLPVDRLDPVTGRGLVFDLLSSASQPVITGHADGVVTLDLAEGDDPHREAVRLSMGEPYRTVLGHLRHEVGHYYWQVLVGDAGDEVLAAARTAFGDHRVDYAEALATHYSRTPSPDWNDTHVSTYATAHPWEDFAETFAHYLHIRDTLQTAAAYGVLVAGPDTLGSEDLESTPGQERVHGDVDDIVGTWLPLSYALNAINRSMGKDDLYPFVLSPLVIGKLDLVHRLVTAAAA